MNKFKAWLIRKLGGCVYLEQSQKIVFKTVPCETFKVKIALPPAELAFNETEQMEIANREAAEKIGHFIIENHLCDVLRNYNIEFNREMLQYTIRVVQSTQDESNFKLKTGAE